MDNTALDTIYKLCYRYSMFTHTKWYHIIRLISLYIKILYLKYKFYRFNVFDQCDALHSILYQIIFTNNIILLNIDLTNKYIWFQSKKFRPYDILYYPSTKMFDISVENYTDRLYQFKYYLNQNNLNPEVEVKFNDAIPKIKIAIKYTLDSILRYLKNK